MKLIALTPTARLPHTKPVGGSITTAQKASPFHESLHQHRSIAVASRKILPCGLGYPDVTPSALKNGQTEPPGRRLRRTCGERHAYFGDRTLGRDGLRAVPFFSLLWGQND